MRIIIVEDHQKINNLLALYARQDGHLVTQCLDAKTALDKLTNKHFDIIITDLMLPDMQGEELIGEIRKYSDIYIMVISAKTETNQRVDVLSLGADDYLTKPFSVEEVMVKLDNVSKRIKQNHPTVVSYYHKELQVFPLKREMIFKGEKIVLTKHEFDLFYYLMKNNNIIISREALMENLFRDSEAYDRVVDAYIKNIRKKVDDDANSPRYIKSHYGIGYQFIGEQDD